mgnify:CR=1 FL=1
MAIVNNKNNSSRFGKAFKYSMLASCLASAFTSYAATANQVIWSENFDDPAIDGKGAIHTNIDMVGVTKWSIDVSGAQLTASSDWFQVKSGKLEARDVDGDAVWLSEVIDVSAATGINISVSASESGTHEGTDYFDLAYSLDGAAFVLVTDWQGKGSASHTLVDDFTAETVTVDLNAASTLQVKVIMKNNAGSEYIRLDDVVISHGSGGGDTGGGDTGGGDTGGGDTGGGDTGGGDTGGGDTGGSTITNACFNCPDLTKIADATQFDAVQYYQPVTSAISASESALQIKEKLNTVITTNFNSLTYSEVWTALTQTDEDPLNTSNVILLYKGTSLAKFSNGSGTQSGDPDNWNREHVWAKSHGFPSSSAYAYTDIHHLRPTDISVNSSRGNLDFDLSDSPLSEAPANRVDSDSFEPRDAVKGDVARMILYMDVRYQGLDGSTPDLEVVNRITSTGEAKLGKLCTLLSWHEQDPVDSFEQTRNNRAYEFQGNRNPFIDHPEWVNIVFDNATCDGTGGGDTGGGDTGGGDTGGGDTGGGDTGGGETGSTLIISEYIEGSSSNKALEIFNPTGATVDLSSYQLKLYSNGSTSANTTYSMSGSLAANDVIVIGNGNAAEPLKSALDVISGVANFNGDDYVELLNNGTVVDGIGTYGIRTNWGQDVTLVRKASVIVGDSNPNDSFDLSVEWDQKAKDDFSFIGAHTSDAGTGSGGGTDPGTPVLGQCADTAEMIHNIQGTGSASPMVDNDVTIEGVVSAVYPSLSGYFVQEEVADQDSDLNTSEGIFVYHANASTYPTAGQLVRVIGTVKEHYGRTQLATTVDALDCGSVGIPAATAISLPVQATDSFEAVEGMLVESEAALSVTNTLELAKYGQFVVSNGRLFKPTNVFAPNSAAAISLAEANGKNQLIIDDAVNGSYPASVPFPTGGLSHSNTLRLGDTVVGLTGNMDYSFGAYRVLPNASLNVVANNARTTAPSITGSGSLTVASFNVLNYFNGPSFPTARGADSSTEFERQSAKIVAAIAAVNADIVGLMEIENDGYAQDSAIADLVAKVNAVLGSQVYDYVKPTTTLLGSDAIAVGFIYKPSTVALDGNAVTTTVSPFDYGNRQPLAQTFTELSSGESLTVAVNHFKSKGSCGSASGANADQGDGQGCWNELRTQASSSLISWLATKPTGTSDDDVLVIGDLNAYAKEDPITALTSQGYKDLVSSYEGAGAYTYAFAGEMGNLDHALANESLAAQVEDTTIWHINADEPVALDYNVEKKSVAQQSDYYGADSFRASDHDPIIVSFSLSGGATLVGDFDNDGDIDINDVRAFSTALRAGESFSLDYDFNGDGVVNSLDVRAMMKSCSKSRCAA